MFGQPEPLETVKRYCAENKEQSGSPLQNEPLAQLFPREDNGYSQAYRNRSLQLIPAIGWQNQKQDPG